MSNAKPLSSAELNNFVERIKATIAQAERGAELQKLFAKIAGTPNAAPAVRAAGKAAAKKSGRRVRKPGVDPQKVAEFMKTLKGPQSIGTIAKGLKESNDRIRAALLKLREKKVAKMTGTRALAKWQLV